MNLILKRVIIFYSILLVFYGCKQETTPLKPEPGLNEKFKFNVTEYQKTLESRFTDKAFSSYLTDSSFQYLDTLKHFYAERNYNPVFIKSFEEKNLAGSIISILEKADEHGLDPGLYHVNLISKEFYKAINDTIENPDRLMQLANSELFIADAVLKYSYHMRYGVVNPQKFFPVSYTLPVVDSSKRDLFEPLKQSDIVHYLNEVQPKSERYKMLQTALKHYNNYKNIEWKTIPIPDKKIEIGSQDSTISLVADRLITLGFLDTTKIGKMNFPVYDSLLLEPIKKFQRLNGLNDDGVIGKSTIEKLNITPEEYITKIKVNLERFRWNNYADSSKYILVNIPDFKLYAIEDGKEIFNIKVCTGSKRSASFNQWFETFKKSKQIKDKPNDWETPCVYGEISYLVLNPTWTVPQNIIREEILRGIKKDSTYLFTKNFKVFKNGIEMNPSLVKLKELALENIPYTIIQDPGVGNALGKIKFMFKNPFGIYLHDTPTRGPFSHSNRAVSHGCIRLEKPLMFAEYILKDNSNWNMDYVKIEIGQKPDDQSKISEYNQKRNELRKNMSYGKTTNVVLDKKILLFVDYYTAWVDENGDINFRDDIYRKDEILKNYLFPETKFNKLTTVK